MKRITLSRKEKHLAYLPKKYIYQSRNIYIAVMSVNTSFKKLLTSKNVGLAFVPIIENAQEVN